MWTNYHSHTNFSDGSSNPEEYIESAIANNILAYGFSCHAPVEFDCNWTIHPKNLPGYLQEVDRLKKKYSSKIQIYKSLEIDYFPNNPLSQPSEIKKLGLDYTIGSIHFVDNFKDGTNWNVDTSKRIYDAGMLEIFDGNGKAAVTRFYELTSEMLRVMNPCIIGHLDKIKMLNYKNEFFDEHASWYETLIDNILTQIAQAGSIIEVNTRGIYRTKIDAFYPGDWILYKAQKLNIPVTICSDCHKPNEVICEFPAAARMLQSVGYRKIHILYDNKWQAVDFTENGIVIPHQN